MTAPFFPAGFRATDDNDNPLAGGQYRYFAAGTTTPKEVYADAARLVTLGTIVNLDSSGSPVDGMGAKTAVFAGVGAYKVELYDSVGVLVPGMTFDNLPGADPAATADPAALPETPVIAKTSAYTVLEADAGTLINANPTSGSFAITLPSAVSVGDGFRIGVRHNGSANQVSVVSVLGQAIKAQKSATSIPLVSYGETVWLVSDGADWSVDSYVPPSMKANLPYVVVLDRLTAPPSAPVPGARYLINGAPTGLWNTLGFADKDIAEADGNGSWIRHTPAEGWMVQDADESILLQYRGGAWVEFLNIASPSVHVLPSAIFEHQLSTGNNGGTATANAWTKRTLNTSVQNDIDGVSLASSQITLPPGKYLIQFSQALWAQNPTPVDLGDMDQRIRVVSGTATPTNIKAIAGHNGSGVDGSTNTIYSNMAFVSNGILTVTATAIIELQYWHAHGGNSSAELGWPSSESSGLTEIYARVIVVSLTAPKGERGGQGLTGQDGLDAAYAYQWNTATAGDPTAGKLLGNSGTPASITQLNISETDANTASLAAVVATWDDSSSTVKARIRFHKEGAPQNFMEFLIAGAGTDQGSYWTFPVTYVAHGGTLSNADALALLVIERGDKGDAGLTGPTGSTSFDFDASTVDADPGNGEFRLNALPATATEAFVDNLNRGGVDVSAWLDTFDDSGASGLRGTLMLMRASAPQTNFFIFDVTGFVVDGTGYRKITIAYRAGAGTLSGETLFAFFPRGPAGSGMAEVSDDTSPQLGGDLDTNGRYVDFDDNRGIRDDAGNEHIIFHKTASAVNQVGFTNAATGNAPKWAAEGGDTNIDLALGGKGTGGVRADSQLFFPAPNLTDAANIDWNLTTQQVGILTLGGNRTLNAPSNQKAGACYTLIIKQDGTGSRTLTWNSVYKFPGGADPVLSTAANAVDIVCFVSDGTSMYGFAAYAFA